jgi:hypothetical protein
MRTDRQEQNGAQADGCQKPIKFELNFAVHINSPVGEPSKITPKGFLAGYAKT